jgi:RHS repeat-associated protein
LKGRKNWNTHIFITCLNGPGIDNHLRQTNSISSVSYFLTDHVGTTTALTDATANIVEHLAYDSFGNSTGSARTRYGYNGRERDPDTRVLHYRAHFYDPQVGRFLGEDPIGLVGGFNLYEYAYDNPLRFVDPTGTQWREAALAGGGTLGGLSGTGALGAAAAAALPPVAVAAAGAALIYGARRPVLL